MTLDEFAVVTQGVIAREGFAEFQPTAVYPERDHIRGGADFPATVPESHIFRWGAEEQRDGEEMLLAFKVDDSHFKIIRQIATYSEDEIYHAATPKA